MNTTRIIRFEKFPHPVLIVYIIMHILCIYTWGQHFHILFLRHCGKSFDTFVKTKQELSFYRPKFPIGIIELKIPLKIKLHQYYNDNLNTLRDNRKKA